MKQKVIIMFIINNCGVSHFALYVKIDIKEV